MLYEVITHGYDSMLLSILQNVTEGKKIEGKCTGKLNLIPGFEGNTGNIREYKRILDLFGIPYTIMPDISDVFDSVCDGTYRLYPGGTSLEDAAESINGKATLSMQKYSTVNTMKWIKSEYEGVNDVIPMPMRNNFV